MRFECTVRALASHLCHMLLKCAVQAFLTRFTTKASSLAWYLNEVADPDKQA